MKIVKTNFLQLWPFGKIKLKWQTIPQPPSQNVSIHIFGAQSFYRTQNWKLINIFTLENKVIVRRILCMCFALLCSALLCFDTVCIFIDLCYIAYLNFDFDNDEKQYSIRNLKIELNAGDLNKMPNSELSRERSMHIWQREWKKLERNRLQNK